jgi:hypothetical protein
MAKGGEGEPRSEEATPRLTRDETYALVGWLLFVASAVSYTVSSIQAESLSSLIGSLFFLAACFPFMISLLWKEKTT